MTSRFSQAAVPGPEALLALGRRLVNARERPIEPEEAFILLPLVRCGAAFLDAIALTLANQLGGVGQVLEVHDVLVEKPGEG